MQPREIRLYLQDLLESGERIIRLTGNISFAEYEAHDVIPSAVERMFEIIGEALVQLRKFHPDYVLNFSATQPIIDFRNRVIHGYFSVDREVVWSIAKARVPSLVVEVKQHLAALEG